MYQKLFVVAVLCLGIFSSAIKAAEDTVGLMVKVRTPYENFSRRLEVLLKDKINQDSFFDLMENPRFGGHQAIVEIDIKYPVYAFPKQETFYVKFSGLSKSDKYLCLSIPSRGKGKLTLNEEKVLSKDLVLKVLKQIKSDLDGSSKLNLGYFSNKQQLEVEQKLVIELLGKRTKKEPLRELESMPESSHVKSSKIKELTIKEENEIHSKAHKNITTKANKVKEIRRELKMTWEGKKRSKLLREMALNYLEEGQNADALAYALKAYEDNPSEENFELVRKLETNEMYPTDRIRFNNRINNFDFSFYLKTEVDTNVVQDSVDSVIHSNSDDLLIQAGLLFDKKWSWTLGQFEQFSSYDFNQSYYAEEQDLDLMSHRLGHEMSKEMNDHTRFSFGFGYNYFVRRGKSLLDGGDFNLGVSHYVTKFDQVYNVSLFWLDKNYSDHFYNSDTKDGSQWRLNFDWKATLFKGHHFGFNVGLTKDDVKDKTISYDAGLMGVNWGVDVNHLLLNQIISSFGYQRREYLDAQPGRNKRKDAKFIYGLQGIKKLSEYQQFNLNLLYTDNQSLRRVNKYRRTQVSLGYQLDF